MFYINNSNNYNNNDDDDDIENNDGDSRIFIDTAVNHIKIQCVKRRQKNGVRALITER
ncbi:7436_t:CDS:2 [Entrophospora sp. SA101]|nr:7436_t:CDS:2 [Entrophospora sp. SA101]